MRFNGKKVHENTAKYDLLNFLKLKKKNSHIIYMRLPGIEPGSTAWKATMLTFTPQTR